MANLAALRAAVSSLSAKNLRGVDIRPPGLARVKKASRRDGFKVIQGHEKNSKISSKPLHVYPYNYFRHFCSLNDPF